MSQAVEPQQMDTQVRPGPTVIYQMKMVSVQPVGDPALRPKSSSKSPGNAHAWLIRDGKRLPSGFQHTYSKYVAP